MYELKMIYYDLFIDQQLYPNKDLIKIGKLRNLTSR